MSSPRKPLRIGILGAARIAPAAIVYPAHVGGHELVAVASRDRGRGEVFANQYQVAKVHDSYRALIEDPDVDVVYNALHNAAHGPWNIVALRAGKHVLTEKPSASNAIEAAEVLATEQTSNKIFMEGFHYLYHPVMQRVLEVISSGEIGEVTEVYTALVIPAPSPEDLRWQWELAGGSLMDVGCYALHSQRMISHAMAGVAGADKANTEAGRAAEPKVVSSEAAATPTKVDIKATVQLEYPNGAKGVAVGSFDHHEFEAPLRVKGTLGSVEAPCFVLAHTDDRVIVEVGGKKRVEHLGSVSTYTYQLQAFADAVDFGTPFVTDARDALTTMQMIDAAYDAADLPSRPVFAIE